MSFLCFVARITEASAGEEPVAGPRSSGNYDWIRGVEPVLHAGSVAGFGSNPLSYANANILKLLFK